MQGIKQARQAADANQLLSELAVHALLHLEFRRLATADKSLSVKDSNDLLQKWLKPKLKSNRYKLIKKPLKTLTQQAKGEQGNLAKLLEKCVGAETPPAQPHLDSYLLLINEIEKKLGTTVLLSRAEDVDLSHDENGCLLCVLTQNLNDNFDSQNTLIKPISMLFRGPMSQRSLFLGAIYANNTYGYSVQYQDEQFVRITLELV
ncbi:DUF2913 family protein [Vibrio navarrensis]|uniref:DUF2913 domain-containing protein n=1 Tax=Vibrio navarrensis TaxID=29495 RepID=A0A099LW31_9VIBR|nr:DUF2913 family protein [Vibrio navarrensis]KGK11482.1 hypothetical protein EA26_09230 [Vibrio navarrensis]MBE4615463.1 hypothetical protein [Vibrio navarrensis]QOD68443.1 DUF2913 family protein [Vibrio navarrensis]